MMDRGQQTTKNRRRQHSALCLLSCVLCLLLSGCGFHSVYASHDSSDSPVAMQLQQVAVDGIPDRPGQILRNALIDRMYGKGRPAQPLYHLKVTEHSNETDVGVLANAVSTLAELDTYADYVLTDAHGAVILKGTAHSQTSYSRLNDQYAELVGHDSAVERTLHEISEQIVNRVSLYFAEPSPAPPAPPPPPPATPVPLYPSSPL